MDIDAGDFEELFGGPLSQQALDVVRKSDFTYRSLSSKEKEAAVTKYLSFLGSEKKQSGPDYQGVWEEGWKENLDEFLSTASENALIPKFVKNNQPVRFRGEMVMPSDSGFETNFVPVLRDYYFRSYFAETESIVEFGCGTGTNLVHLSRILPGVKLIGSDWAASSIQLVNHVSGSHGLQLEGVLLDMFAPEGAGGEKCSEADGAFTMGAMEQLGQDYRPFLDYLLNSNVRRVIHFETAYELYRLGNMWDLFARAYLEKRNWLRGYFATLAELETTGHIRILHQGKTFGSFFHDGYTVTVWEKA